MKQLLFTTCLLLMPSLAMADYAFLQAATPDTTDTDTYTFSSQNLGTAAADRYIIVAAAGRTVSTDLNISSITVGGVTATVVQSAQSAVGDNDLTIAIAAVPTGTTGDVVVTYNTTSLRCQICLWRATGLASATPTDTDQDDGEPGTHDPSVSLTVPNGFAVGIVSNDASTSVTWSGLTNKRYDDTLEGGFYTVSMADVATTTGVSPLAITGNFAAPSTDDSAGAFASWELSSGNPLLLQLQYGQ